MNLSDRAARILLVATAAIFVGFIVALTLAGCFLEDVNGGQPAHECKWWYAPEGCYEPWYPPPATRTLAPDHTS